MCIRDRAHNGVIITLNGIQPDRRAALDGVGTGLIVGLLCGGVPLDLLLAQWEKGDLAGIHKALGAGTIGNADTGVHLSLIHI